ncbi:MAG: 3-hydroxyacyl-CoA dehydrogenase/enoyl-CoA hydratase family protein [bacterium]|nr:3-hydroxyacyl-CoA dehydrogenase/enoyl-CoA hydratase family protein [bacterium]
MIVGVIGSGAIGPDLAYGFASALAGAPNAKVYLHDIDQSALDAGGERIRGYVAKGVARGKLNPKKAAAVTEILLPTLQLTDLADCDYVLEAATEDLEIKKVILAGLEEVIGKDCLVGFATSGLPRARIAASAEHPDRCFVNHPFFPAWRALPMEVVLSPDADLSERMLSTLRRLGKVPIETADVPCFAADDIFCNYCAEAARIHVEGLATPAQVDRIVNEAIGGGGPFNVMDLTRGNLLNVKCLKLMEDAETGSPWFAPPAVFSEQANTPWLDPNDPGETAFNQETGRQVLDRILAVLLGRTYFVADNGICDPADLNWLTRNALGFAEGLLDLAENLGAARVREVCVAYAADNPGFEVPPSVAAGNLLDFRRNVKVERSGELAVVSVHRPEVLNALNERTMNELSAVFAELGADDAVQGVVLTSYGGSLAGADINELAALKTPQEAADKCRHGHAVLREIENFAKPVVAAVNGPVLGGGSELAMACHARVVGRGLVWGQPEVNLGIIPGYGGTQRLPRLVGVERAAEVLRTGRTVTAAEACDWGWAVDEPAADPVAAARTLLQAVVTGERDIARLDPAPMPVPDTLPEVAIGHRSLVIDRILTDVVFAGLTRELDAGLEAEAEAFARCRRTVDYGIGMTNFIQNGPRIPAVFMNE